MCQAAHEHIVEAIAHRKADDRQSDARSQYRERIAPPCRPGNRNESPQEGDKDPEKAEECGKATSQRYHEKRVVHGRNDAFVIRNLSLSLQRVFRKLFDKRIISVPDPDHRMRRHLPQADGPHRQPGINRFGGHGVALKPGLRGNRQPHSGQSDQSQHAQRQAPSTDHQGEREPLRSMAKPSTTGVGKELRGDREDQSQ